MFKPKNLMLLASAILLGCQMSRNTPPEAQNDSPLIVDGAMQLRDWDRSTAYYGNGDVVAGPTGFPFEPAWNQPEWHYALIETPLFVTQAVLIPIPLIITPPWTPIRNTGATIEPSYTAMPALPGSASSTAGVPSATTPPPAQP